MKVDRASLLQALTIAHVGLTSRELLEQSNSYCFTGEHLVTFNGEILTRVANPVEGLVGVVPAEDMLGLLGKFPDDEVDITRKGEELRIKGNRRAAGIALQVEVTLPYGDVPLPKKWKAIDGPLLGTLFQGALICGTDETKPITTAVRIAPDMIDATDNYRMFRSKLETGYEMPKKRKEILVPASSLQAISSMLIRHTCYREGWIHFRTKSKHTVSIRTTSIEYPDLTDSLKLVKPNKVVLPSNLVDILQRASVCQDNSFDASVSITIEAGELTLKAKKDAAWFRENKSIKYDGPPLRFSVNPKVLEEVLQKTRRVTVGGNKLRIESGETVFVISLEVGDKK